MGKKTRRAGAAYKLGYKNYKDKNTYAANKKKKLERHMKLHPNDEQAAKVLAKGEFKYNRTKSKSKNLQVKNPPNYEMLRRQQNSIKSELPEYKQILLDLLNKNREVKVKFKHGRENKAVYRHV